jgi:hypothetical protein
VYPIDKLIDVEEIKGQEQTGMTTSKQANQRLVPTHVPEDLPSTKGFFLIQKLEKTSSWPFTAVSLTTRF